ncbi:MAG TPA: chloride channel protein, partial [Gemmatimonadales bacterium]|nr:chloride channel protein [Gemmatimonadales bacterium]
TIGSGGAAGREGPTAQIGSGFGAFIADRFNLGAVERRRTMAAGIGAGIGSIFRAPLGGAMMSVEVLYKHDLEADVILLGLISSIVGYSVYGLWAGWDPIFGGGADFSFTHPQELVYYAALGVLCGVFGILYARGFYGTVHLFHRLNIPRMFKPAIGGLVVGIIGMFAPEAIHVGYGTIQQMLTTDGVLAFSPWLLLTLPLLRIATTSFSVGSGGSGGIFGPGMVIGGVLGAAAWRFGHGLPGFPTEPGPVVIICMIALFGSVAHAPLAMLLMVGEMTGNLSLLAPAMVAVAVATLVVGETTIYTSQVPTRADSPAHRHRFAFPLLTSLPSGRAVTPVASVPGTATPSEALQLMEAGQARYSLIDHDGDLPREISRADVERAISSGEHDAVEALSQPIPTTVRSDTPLDEALDLLAKHERSWLPVRSVDDGRILGAIDARALVRTYREAARSGVTPLATLADEGDYLKITLKAPCPAVGRTLTDLSFPRGARVISITRKGHMIIPDGQTVLRQGDELVIATSKQQQTRVLRLLGQVK